MIGLMTACHCYFDDVVMSWMVEACRHRQVPKPAFHRFGSLASIFIERLWCSWFGASMESLNLNIPEVLFFVASEERDDSIYK